MKFTMTPQVSQLMNQATAVNTHVHMNDEVVGGFNTTTTDVVFGSEAQSNQLAQVLAVNVFNQIAAGTIEKVSGWTGYCQRNAESPRRPVVFLSSSSGPVLEHFIRDEAGRTARQLQSAFSDGETILGGIAIHSSYEDNGRQLPSIHMIYGNGICGKDFEVVLNVLSFFHLSIYCNENNTVICTNDRNNRETKTPLSIHAEGLHAGLAEYLRTRKQ